MAKTMKTVIELESMILKELRAFPKCHSVSMVTIRGNTEQGKSDWNIRHVNYGSALEEDCKQTLQQIVNRLRGEFGLA